MTQKALEKLQTILDSSLSLTDKTNVENSDTPGQGNDKGYAVISEFSIDKAEKADEKEYFDVFTTASEPTKAQNHSVSSTDDGLQVFPTTEPYNIESVTNMPTTIPDSSDYPRNESSFETTTINSSLQTDLVSAGNNTFVATENTTRTQDTETKTTSNTEDPTVNYDINEDEDLEEQLAGLVNLIITDMKKDHQEGNPREDKGNPQNEDEVLDKYEEDVQKIFEMERSRDLSQEEKELLDLLKF